MNKIKKSIAKVSPGYWIALAAIASAACVIYGVNHALAIAAPGSAYVMGWLSVWAAVISWAIVQVRGGEFPVVERDALFPIVALAATYGLTGSLAGWLPVAVSMCGGIILSLATTASKKHAAGDGKGLLGKCYD